MLHIVWFVQIVLLLHFHLKLSVDFVWEGRNLIQSKSCRQPSFSLFLSSLFGVNFKGNHTMKHTHMYIHMVSLSWGPKFKDEPSTDVISTSVKHDDDEKTATLKWPRCLVWHFVGSIQLWAMFESGRNCGLNCDSNSNCNCNCCVQQANCGQ